MPEQGAVYAYGFIDRRLALPDFGDAGGQPLLAHRHGSLAAVVRRVSRAEFCGDAAEANLRDPAWVTPRACAHAAVLDRIMRCGAVFPLGFATLFSGFAGLESVIERHQPAIEGFLGRVAGKEEWGIEIAADLDRQQLLEELALARWPQLRDLPTGARYLRLRRAHDELLAMARNRAVAAAQELVGALAPRGELRPLRSPDGERLGRWALLVDRAEAALLKQRVDDLAARAIRHAPQVRLSGPWPPYSFRPALDAEAPGAATASCG